MACIEPRVIPQQMLKLNFFNRMLMENGCVFFVRNWTLGGLKVCFRQQKSDISQQKSIKQKESSWACYEPILGIYMKIEKNLLAIRGLSSIRIRSAMRAQKRPS